MSEPSLLFPPSPEEPARWYDPLRKLLPPPFRADVPVVPVVRLSGAIGAVTPLRPGLTLATVSRVLDRAFAVRKARAVALLINSPGGSPAQSHLIYLRIRQLARDKKLPVFAFIEDAGASGGYMLACAADEIFCDRFSIVGSIGVVGATFGFHALMEKIGVERRVYTAGERKVMLDPFRPEKPEDVERIHAIQKDIHAHFIALVKERRGARLAAGDDVLFSGEFWTADRAIALGLADRLGDVRGILRERFGEKVRMPLMQAGRSFLGLKLPGGTAITVDTSRMADGLIAAAEERALWARYGL